MFNFAFKFRRSDEKRTDFSWTMKDGENATNKSLSVVTVSLVLLLLLALSAQTQNYQRTAGSSAAGVEAEAVLDAARYTQF
jgi:hypothetical protein